MLCAALRRHGHPGSLLTLTTPKGRSPMQMDTLIGAIPVPRLYAEQTCWVRNPRFVSQILKWICFPIPMLYSYPWAAPGSSQGTFPLLAYFQLKTIWKSSHFTLKYNSLSLLLHFGCKFKSAHSVTGNPRWWLIINNWY